MAVIHVRKVGLNWGGHSGHGEKSSDLGVFGRKSQQDWIRLG